jgi:hypothetical protein
LSGNDLFVANDYSGVVGEYDATTGTAINASFITGLSNPQAIVVRPPPPCALTDTASYDATTSTLTMNFTVGNNEKSAVTWSGWLTYQNTIDLLFSESLPITKPPEPITKTATLVSGRQSRGSLHAHHSHKRDCLLQLGADQYWNALISLHRIIHWPTGSLTRAVGLSEGLPMIDI